MRSALLGALAAVWILSSCGPLPREPRPVRPESDVCPECRMTVIPEGHAAESVDGEGTVLVFDDPGCLALYAHDHPDRVKGATFFVQDVETKAWVPFDQAAFVRADDVPSPMNYGWHAFASEDRARVFSKAHEPSFVVTSRPLEALADDLQDRRWRP